MLPVDIAISKFRRDLTIAALLRAALLTVAVTSLVAQPLFGFHQDWMPVLILVGGLWLLLSYRSVQGSRIAADSPSLIASGEFDRAESHIDSALNSFSLFRAGKLLNLHHLAVLRHAQNRWRESALLCQALLSQKLGNMQPMARTSLLMLADSQIQLGEALTLQLLQLDYSWRIGAWESMLQGVGGKVQMSELMPPMNAARSQALLAVAAYKLNRTDLANWLRRRAELLADPRDISAGRPVLEEMFRQNT
jgi:hypothetical protein